MDDQTLRALQGDGLIDQPMTNEIKQMCDGITDTLKSQLGKYLTGTLSVPTPALLEATENAPVHNMFPERILGMTDAELKRAPNASIDLVSAKIRCKVNGTMPWVGTMTQQMQRKLVRSAVHQRRVAMVEQKQRKQRILHTLNQRLYEVIQKQAKKETTEMEKMVSKLIVKGTSLTTDDVEQQFPREQFPSIDADMVSLIIKICHQPISVKGEDLSHLWFDKDKCQWDLYCGSICKYKKTPKQENCKYEIEYWLPGCPEDSHKILLSVKAFIADIILGDLVLT